MYINIRAGYTMTIKEIRQHKNNTIRQQIFTYLIHVRKEISSIDTRFFTVSIALMILLVMLTSCIRNIKAELEEIQPKIPKSIIHMLAHIQFKEFHDFFLKRCHCCINLLALPFNSNHPQGFHFIYDFLHIMAFKPSRLVHDVFDL